MSRVYSEFDFTRKNNRPENTFKLFLYACVVIFLIACSDNSQYLPEGFAPFYPKFEAWENCDEGFALICVSSADGAQGFLEWRTEGVYGRIVETSGSRDTRSFLIGDGGMNGLVLNARKKGDSLEISYEPTSQSAYIFQEGVSQHRVTANRSKAIKDLKLLAGLSEETQESGRKISMRLQYLVSRESLEEKAFNDFLRRGNSPYKMAEFRRQRLETSPIAKYELPEDSGNLDSEPAKNVPNEDGSGQIRYWIPPIEFYEIQYPVYVGENIISVATQYYLFNGGAHGSASTDFDIIDRRTGKRLGPSDIFVSDWRSTLGPKLKVELIRQSGFWQDSAKSAKVGNDGNSPIEDLRDLGFFESDISPSDKIFLCKTGIGFEYDRYEIAPWYMGEFIILLSWDELRPFLNPALFADGELLGSI